MAGVKVSAGDAVFIRTGRWARRAAVGAMGVSRAGRRPGPIASVIPWLKKREIAFSAATSAQHRARPTLRGDGAGPRFCAGDARRASVRQLRSRGAGRCGCRAEAMGVSADGCAVCYSWRHRISHQSNRDVFDRASFGVTTDRRGSVARLRAHRGDAPSEAAHFLEAAVSSIPEHDVVHHVDAHERSAAASRAVSSTSSGLGLGSPAGGYGRPRPRPLRPGPPRETRRAAGRQSCSACRPRRPSFGERGACVEQHDPELFDRPRSERRQ